MFYAVIVRGAAAPAGVIAPGVHSAPLDAPVPEQPRACTELTKAGNPCQGTPGDDGLCAAHKPKGEADAGAVPAAVDADPPA